ncbi:MAG TPA: Gfo/Idh/MocA family oxidoreductase [Amycolatopsis sp.]|nr:Gfo/Idh/MocA family oxidoreductase [Amycolatopsis sp.]
MEPLRIGILGAARIAGLAIVAPARELGHRLVAVAARDRDRAAAFAAEHGVERVSGSYADLLADPEVEVVYNGLVNGWHGPWNLAAIAAGKHVLTEKPFSSNAEEARVVRDAAARAGVQVLEGFHYLYHPVTSWLLETIGSGKLGEVREVEVVVDIEAPRSDDPRWSLDIAGGAVMDVGCYGVHLLRQLAPWTGAPRVASARGVHRAGLSDVDEHMAVEFAFPSGAVGRMRCGMNADRLEFSCRVVGSAGTVMVQNFVRPDMDDTVVLTTEAGRTVRNLGRRPSYSFQLEALAAQLRGGTGWRNDMDDAVATMELIDDCYRAAGFPVRPRSEIRS